MEKIDLNVELSKKSNDELAEIALRLIKNSGNTEGILLTEETSEIPVHHSFF